MKPVLLLLLALCPLCLLADTAIPLKEAVSKGFVTISATGEGGFTGKVLALDIASKHKKELTLAISAGLTFAADDSTVQDLMITEDRQLVLAAGAKRKLIVNAMCIEPYNGGPRLGSAFLLGAMAGDTLVKLAQYIATKGYQDDLGQSAVWTIINNEGLENVYGSDPVKLKDMVQYMHTITGKPLPWYHKEKGPSSPTQVYNPEPAIVHANFDFSLPMAGSAKIAIYNEAGETVYTIKDNMMVKSGKSTMKFRIEVRGYEKGKYYVRLHLNGKLQEEKVFEL